MIGVAIIFVCAIVVIRVSNLYVQSRELTETEYALERKIDAANQEHDNLVSQEQYMQTRKYIEDVAKDKLGLVYPDEIVIKPSESK